LKIHPENIIQNIQNSLLSCFPKGESFLQKCSQNFRRFFSSTSSPAPGVILPIADLQTFHTS
jgi:hypothetical protein